MPPPGNNSGEYDAWFEWRRDLIAGVNDLNVKHDSTIQRLSRLEANEVNARDEKQAMWARLEKYEAECKSRQESFEKNIEKQQKQFEESMSQRITDSATENQLVPVAGQPDPTIMQRTAPYTVPTGIAAVLYGLIELIKALGGAG